MRVDKGSFIPAQKTAPNYQKPPADTDIEQFVLKEQKGNEDPSTDKTDDLPPGLNARPSTTGAAILLERQHPREVLTTRKDLLGNQEYRSPDGLTLLTGDDGTVKWVEVEQVPSSKNGKKNKLPELDTLQPDTVYRIGWQYFQTDDKSRVVDVHAILGRDTRKSNASGARSRRRQKLAASFGEDGEVGGHFLGRQFDGPIVMLNMMPMSKEFNSAKPGNYGALENVWRKIQKADPHALIYVDMTIDYPDSGQRPNGITVRWTYDGLVMQNKFANI